MTYRFSLSMVIDRWKMLFLFIEAQPNVNFNIQGGDGIRSTIVCQKKSNITTVIFYLFITSRIIKFNILEQNKHFTFYDSVGLYVFTFHLLCYPNFEHQKVIFFILIQ